MMNKEGKTAAPLAFGALGFLLIAVLTLVPLIPVVSAQSTIVNVTIPSGASRGPGFSPDTITVVIGVNNTVEWTNNDSVTHTVTAPDMSFDSGNLAAGKSYTHTFTTAGTYPYVCVYHSAMQGTVVVKAQASTSSTTPEFPANAVPVVLLVAVTAVLAVAQTRPRASQTS